MIVLIFYLISFFLSLNWFQIALWLVLCWKPIPVIIILSKMFFAGNFIALHLLNCTYCVLFDCCIDKLPLNVYMPAAVSLFAALGFLLYGGR